MSASLTSKPTPTVAARDDRPALAIDEILRWVIRDELPKRRSDQVGHRKGSGLHPMWRAGILGVRVDNWSREPGMPLAAGDPHPDALLVEEALAELDQAIKAADEGRGPLPLDLTPYRIDAGLGADCQLARVSARAILSAIPWVITTAKQGGTPDFGSGVEIAPVIGSRGRVTIWRTVEEHCGEDSAGRPLTIRTDRVTEVARGGSYSAGSFCKLKWSRRPADVAEDRATYAGWHAALCWLAERLGGANATGLPALASRRPKPPATPMSPWIQAAPERRVLRAIDAVAGPLIEGDASGARIALPQNAFVGRRLAA